MKKMSRLTSLTEAPGFRNKPLQEMVAVGLTTNYEDFSDRWSSGDHIRDRDWVLKTLLRHQNSHPRQRLVLLSADIHFLIFNHQNDRPVCVYRSEWV
jgi:hypothetical protein